MKRIRTPEELKAYRLRKSIKSYYKLKADPARYAAYLEKRRVYEKERYHKLK